MSASPPAAEALRLQTRRWARAVPGSTLARAAQRGCLPEALVRDLLAVGVQRAPFPRRAGGLGLGQAGYAAALSELAAVDASLAATVMATVSCATLLHLYATPRQRGRWLRPLLAGTGLGAVALSEPGAGSDLAAVRVRAEPGPRGWRLHGIKAPITNALTPLLGVVVTLARQESGEGLGTFVLAADAPGLERSGPLPTIGWRAAGLGRIEFGGCAVRRGQLVGAPGKGLQQVLHALAYGRVAAAAMAAGAARASFERAVLRARAERAGGPPLSERDAVRQLLVDLWVRSTEAGLWTAHAAAAADRGGDFRVPASMAKLAATARATDNAGAALRLHGAEGARSGGAAAGLFGDAKVLEIVEGATEIQRLILGRALDGVEPWKGTCR